MYIFEDDIKEFFFERLIAVGLVPESAELDIIAEIVFDYLVEIDILEPENIINEEDFEEF